MAVLGVLAGVAIVLCALALLGFVVGGLAILRATLRAKRVHDRHEAELDAFLAEVLGTGSLAAR